MTPLEVTAIKYAELEQSHFVNKCYEEILCNGRTTPKHDLWRHKNIEIKGIYSKRKVSQNLDSGYKRTQRLQTQWLSRKSEICHTCVLITYRVKTQ